ncbi:MAG TPA: hypothetical protein PLU30_13280 [Verrucomicrobiae bacterium]|nr:hypothetical protein [Verrucomicrobiae bacterium]
MWGLTPFSTLVTLLNSDDALRRLNGPAPIATSAGNPPQGNCDRVAFRNGKMIIPAGHYGLFMEK